MGRKMIIYPDTCFYGRPFDWQTQQIKAETDAIKTIIRKCKADGHRIVGSAAVIFEIEEITDDAKRANIEKFYFNSVDEDVTFSAQSIARARNLMADGLGKMDSRHLATAEAAVADFLLTTDVKFIKNSLTLTKVNVMNPLDFVKGGYL
jgi:predicted nucleic acid-binding protein